MMDIKKALVIVGSPKAKLSASHTMGSFLAEQLNQKSIQTKMTYVATGLSSPENLNNLYAAMDDADILAFVFPLYADQLPSGLVQALEGYVQHRQNHKPPHSQSILALVNCGFPEAHQNDIAIAITKRFADLNGFGWLGGLALGQGGMVEGGKPLLNQGGRVRRIRKVLEKSAQAIANGSALPEEAINEIRKPAMPRWLYTFVGNWGFQQAAKKSGLSKKQLVATPFYAEPPK